MRYPNPVMTYASPASTGDLFVASRRASDLIYTYFPISKKTLTLRPSVKASKAAFKSSTSEISRCGYSFHLIW